MNNVNAYNLDDAEPIPYDLDPATVLEGNPQQAAVVVSKNEDNTTVPRWLAFSGPRRERFGSSRSLTSGLWFAGVASECRRTTVR
jgi:hypothetical protein